MKSLEFDCKKTDKKIPLFLKDDLDSDDLRYFLRHIEVCEACKEELTIAFLVKEGLVRLEQGSVFDLNKELALKMDNARKEMLSTEKLELVFHALSMLVFMSSIAVIIMSILLL